MTKRLCARTAIAIATPISAFIMDLPMLREADDGLGLYYAFGLKGASSASLYRSTDAVTWDIVGTGSEEPAFGWAANALGEPCHPQTGHRHGLRNAGGLRLGAPSARR